MDASANGQSRSERRYLALWFPYLATDRLHRARRLTASPEPDDRPLVVVEKVRGALRIAAADLHAAKLGLAHGLAFADARARIPALAVADLDGAADRAFLSRLAASCDRFTPSVALDPPDGLMLDITGCAHLFGGEAPLRDRVSAFIARFGLGLRATIAGTPDAARALARHGGVAISEPGEDARSVTPLSIRAIAGDQETFVALSRAGLHTIGDLARRPSTILAARFGQNLVTRLSRTLGHEDIAITPLRPPAPVIADRQFAEPFTHAEGLEEVLGDLIRDAMQLLLEQGQGGRRFEASFFRSDGAVRRLAVETGRPSRDAAAIARLFHERLGAIADPIDPGFGFDAIRLAVPVTDPLPAEQTRLDGVAEQEDAAVADLIDRLTARFGADRVLMFEAQDTHDPDRESRCVQASSRGAASVAWRMPADGDPPRRPHHLFEPPQPIDVMAEVPDGPPMRFRWRRVLYTIAHAEGPERILPEWWRTQDREARDYYRVEEKGGGRFWIFRRGAYEPSNAPPHWFLHGLFA